MRRALVLAMIAAMTMGLGASAEDVEILPIQTVIANPVTESPAPEPTPSPKASATPNPVQDATPAPRPSLAPSPTIEYRITPSATMAAQGEAAAPTAPASAGGWLMADTQGETQLAVGGIFSGGSTVLGSAVPRTAVTSVRFESSVAGAPEDAWDASADRDGSVLAWLSEDGALTIASEGGVRASADCSHLFAGYSSALSIDFNGCFFTDDALDMSHMFESCWSLAELNVSGLNTARVRDMSYMFSSCSELAKLDLANFQTSAVTNMEGMFLLDEKLSALELSSFDTSSITNMRSMFEGCAGLTALDLSNFRLLRVADMRFMFSGCAALKEVSFRVDLFASQPDTTDMFKDCPATMTVEGRAVDGRTWSLLADYAELKLWSRGDKVRWLQMRLANKGFSPGEIDGVFGQSTEDALRAWQAANGYDATGVPTAAQVWALLG